MSSENIPVRVLTVEYEKVVHILRTEVLLSAAVTLPQTEPLPHAAFTGIWDTGATHTMISRQVIETLKLFPINITAVMTADGERQSYTYLINLILQNKVIFPTLQAIEGHILGGDVLIGMDVITQGDFAVTNKDGKTFYSFRFPSLTHIDFGQEPYSNII